MTGLEFVGVAALVVVMVGFALRYRREATMRDLGRVGRYGVDMLKEAARETEAKARVAIVRWLVLGGLAGVGVVTGGAVAVQLAPYAPEMVANMATTFRFWPTGGGPGGTPSDTTIAIAGTSAGTSADNAAVTVNTAGGEAMCQNQPLLTDTLVNTGWDSGLPSGISAFPQSGAGEYEITGGSIIQHYLQGDPVGFSPTLIASEAGGQGPYWYLCERTTWDANWVNAPAGVNKYQFYPQDTDNPNENTVYGYLMLDGGVSGGSGRLYPSINTQGWTEGTSLIRINAGGNEASGVTLADSVSRGVPHVMETLIKMNDAGSANAWVKVWVDGKLILHGIDRTICNGSSNPCFFARYRFDPIYGGTGGTVPIDLDLIVDTTLVTAGDTVVAMAEGTQLQFIDFESNASLPAGLYDYSSLPLNDSVTYQSSDSALAIAFTSSATIPTGFTAFRDTFPETDSVYIGFAAYFDDSFVGSGQAYHPHLGVLLSGDDGLTQGPRDSYQSWYQEVNVQSSRVYPVFGFRDVSNIDNANISVDLTGSTEDRGVWGCNGENNPAWGNTDCYDGGSYYINGNFHGRASSDEPLDSLTRGEWHYVEYEYVMNSISGSVGQSDGVLNIWVDSVQVVANDSVLYRTNTNATLGMRQWIFAPYIGDGSPQAQTFYLDNVCIRTRRGICS